MRPVRGAASSSVAPPNRSRDLERGLRLATVGWSTITLPRRRPSGASTAKRVVVGDRLARAPGNGDRSRARLNIAVRRLVRLVGAGDHQQTARPRVEPVDDARTQAGCRRRTSGHAHAEQPVHERPASAGSRSGGSAGPPGLRDHEQVLVARTGRARAAPPGRARPSPARSTSIRSPPSSRCDLAGARPVHQRRARRRSRAATSARGSPSRPRHHGVEAAGLAVDRLVGHRRSRLSRSIRPGSRDRSTSRDSRTRADHDRRVGEVEDRPDLQVDEVDHPPGEPRAVRSARSVRLPSAPPRIRPSADRDDGSRWRKAVATITSETMIVAPANSHGALWPEPEGPAGVRGVAEGENAGDHLDRRVGRGCVRPKPWSRGRAA